MVDDSQHCTVQASSTANAYLSETKASVGAIEMANNEKSKLKLTLNFMRLRRKKKGKLKFAAKICMFFFRN